MMCDEDAKYKAKITDRKTGESAVTATLASEFWWREGNGSCDCNRSLELRRALGETVDCKDAAPCYNPAFPDGRYALELVP